MSSVAAHEILQMLLHLAHLIGVATRSAGTAVIAKAIRLALLHQESTPSGESLLKALRYITDAADAIRHLMAEIVEEILAALRGMVAANGRLRASSASLAIERSRVLCRYRGTLLQEELRFRATTKIARRSLKRSGKQRELSAVALLPAPEKGLVF